MKKILFLYLAFAIVSCKANSQKNDSPNKDQKTTSFTLNFPEEVASIEKSAEEWESELSDEAYHVLRKAGTERAFTSDLLNNKKKGVYMCAGCGLPLFSSETKFKSGTGWPSFYKPISEKFIIEDTDYKLGYPRTEIRCARCDGHQGHVFEDGPKPTGLRYCINGVALQFVESEKVNP